MRQTNIFSQRTALHTFLILFFGFLVILASSLFVFNAYWRLTRYHISPNRLARHLVSFVQQSKTIPAMQLTPALHVKRLPGYNVRVSKHPHPKAKQIETIKLMPLRKVIATNPRNVNIAISLDNGYWLNVVSRRGISHWQQLGFISVLVLLLTALFVLCYWVVKRLVAPIDQLTQAAKNYAQNVQVAPLPSSGPKPIRNAIQAFNDMQLRINRMLDNRTQMLAAISHDLRTPITRLQLRAEQITDTKQHEKFMADLNQMEQMINSILSFSRDYISSEVIERINVDALLAAICSDLTDAGLDVEFESSDQRVLLSGRVNALKRAFSNLIENAVKYGKHAEVNLVALDQSVEITIKDHGPGINPDEMNNVFSPFYRVDKARSPEISGSGLGLTVARDIIVAHGGEIKLRNRKEGGLCVVVSFAVE